MPDPIVVYTGATGQKIHDQIKQNNKPFDLTDHGTPKFKMRYADNDTLKVNADGIKLTGTEGFVEYEWVDDDLNQPGEYFGWFHIVLQNGKPINTAETLIIIPQHAPGVRTRTGAIYRRARSILPITWFALENSPKHGEDR